MSHKIEFEKQLDISSCGVACLKMISSFHGKKYPLEYLQALIPAGKDGVSLLSISKAAESIGFKTVGGSFYLNDLVETIHLPCILHWNQNHFVILHKVLKKKKRTKFVVVDPGKGYIDYEEDDFLNYWESGTRNSKAVGVALTLEPTSLFFEKKEIKTEKEKKFRFLFNYFSTHKKFFYQLICGLFIGSILQLLFPFLMQSVVDIGIGNKDMNFVWLILIAQFVLVISRTGVDYIRKYILLHISTRINISLISDFFIKLMKLPMSFFDSKLLGDLIQRIEDHKRIENFITNQSLNLVFSFFSFIVFSIVLLLYNLQIFLIFLTGSILYGLWIMIFLKKRKILDYQSFEQQGINRSKTYQLINGMQEIKLQGTETQKRWEWEDTQADLFNIMLKKLSLQQKQGAGGIFINEIKNLIVTIMSAASVINGDITLGMMLSIQYIIGQLNSPIEQIVNFIYQWQDVSISLERMNEIHNRKDEESEQRNISKLNRGNNDIKLRNVSFCYEGYSTKYVLKNINLTIPQNKITAIVGASGSGKTTLIKLLLGYYRPVDGEILIGNENMNSFNLTWWRSVCGAVMQDGYIFSESIAQNIASTAEGIDSARLHRAAVISNSNPFIEKLPLKYNTIIGQEGQGLSQGQKQRILIARAIYKNPDFLFLDEATNSLDANNEKYIIENLNRFYKNKTVIIIAHRLSTVKNADQIIVLDNGEIVEQGDHRSLTGQKGKYYHLVKNQLELGV